MPYRIIFRNILWMLTERGAQIAGGIIVSGLLARSLGVAQFGLFQYSQSLVFLAASLTLLCGSEVVVPRLVGRTEQAQQHVMLHAFMLRMGAAVLAYVTLALYATTVASDPALRHLVLVLGGALFFREPFGITIAWMQAHTYNRPGVTANICALLLKLALVAGLYITKANPLWFAAVYVAEAVTAAVLMCAYYFRTQPWFGLRFDRALLSELFTTGLAFWIGLIFMMLFKRVDQLVLKQHVTLAELGAYAAAMQVTENFVMVAPIIANSLAPLLIFRSTDLGAAKRNTMRALGIMVAAGAVMAIAIALSSNLIIHVIYGASFALAAQILRISSLIGILVFADAALNLLLIRQGAARWVIAKWVAAAIAAFLGVRLLVPYLGPVAGALGYGLGYIAALAFGFWHLRQR